MKNVKILQEKIKKLQAEIKESEREKMKETGRIALSIFKKKDDLTSENFLKFKERIIAAIFSGEEQ